MTHLVVSCAVDDAPDAELLSGAEAGDAGQQLKLGLWYALNKGPAKDLIRAAEWWAAAVRTARHIHGFCL